MISLRDVNRIHRSLATRNRTKLAAFLLALNVFPYANLDAQVAVEAPAQQHFQWQPGQPIDLLKLPEDVLNCDECRHRLGLPPLPKKVAELNSSTIKPAETKSIAKALKEQPKAEPPTKELAASKPTMKQLGQQIDEKPSKTSTPDALRVEGVLTSPATQKIEIEILKRQLAERDAHLKQFSEMQKNVEERIDQLVRLNEDLAKKDAGRQVELDRVQKTSQQTIQARDLEISNLRADLASVRAESNEQRKRLTDELAESENVKAKEIARLSNEVIETQKARVEAVASLRKELSSSQDAVASQNKQAVAEHSKTVETQKATIRKLEEQLEKAEKAQHEDAERLEKARKEVEVAHSERTKALSELAKQTKAANAQTPKKSKNVESAKKAPADAPSTAKDGTVAEPIVKASEPTKGAVNAEQPEKAPSKPAPVENEPIKNRRAF